MRIALHRRPANPRPPDRLAESGSHLVGHDRFRPISFDDIRRQPDPDWARPSADRQRRWALGQADASYAAIGPYGSAVEAGQRVHSVVVRAHSVLDEIHYAVALMYEVVALAAQEGVVKP